MKSFITILLLTFIGLQSQEEATYEKALAQYKASAFEESLETLRAIFKIDKPRYELHYLAAFDYWNQKNYKSSLDHFRAAIKFKPDDPKAYIDIIKLYNSAENYKSALSLAEDAVKKFPNVPELKFQQVAILLKYGKTDRALEIIESLKQSMSDDYRPLALESNIYYIKKEFEKAEMSLKWATTLAPNNVNLKNNLALIYEQMALADIKANKKPEAKVNLELAKSQVDSAVNYGQNSIFLENQKRISTLLSGLNE